MFNTKKILVYSLPLVALGSGYYFIHHNLLSKYPQKARHHLRSALLAHDYGLGNLEAAEKSYRNAYLETVRSLPNHSMEATGVLDKLADLYNLLGNKKMEREVLDLLFQNLSESKNDVGERQMRIALKTAEKLAELSSTSGKVADEAYYRQWILEASIVPPVPSTTPAHVQPITLQAFADAKQVGINLQALGDLFVKKGMYEAAVDLFQRALEMLSKTEKSSNAAEYIDASVTIHNSLGECLLSIPGKKTSALNMFETASLIGKGRESGCIALVNLGLTMDKLSKTQSEGLDKRQILERGLSCCKEYNLSVGIDDCTKELQKR